MSDYRTEIPASLIDEAELTDLVGRLAKLSGVEAHVGKVFIVSTDDVELSGMLDTLADQMVRRNGKPKKLEGAVKKRKKTVRNEAPTGEKKLGLHSYRNEATGEIVSAQWIHKQLGNNELARDTVFVNGRDERFIVAEVNVGAPFLLVKEGEQA